MIGTDRTFIDLSDVTRATHLVKGARVFPQAFGLILCSDPLVDVGICTASPNATQPHALQRNLYQCVRLGNKGC